MTSNRPYLIRAIYEWIVDNEQTPMLMVREEGVDQGSVLGEDQFTLYDISPKAVRDLVIDDDSVRFHARFQGVARHVVLDPRDVVRVYCRENNDGLAFPWGEEKPSPPDDDPPPRRPHLQIVE